MLILSLLAVLFATVVVTIALALLVVYLWQKWITALRALRVLDNGCQSLAMENGYLRSLLSSPAQSPQVRREQIEPLFIHRSNAIH